MTEKVSKHFADFDVWSTSDMVDAMYQGQVAAINAMKSSLTVIAGAAEAAADRLGDTGRLIYVGAGTSGRLAIMDGAELTPTFGWPRERLVFCIAGGPSAITVSVEGAEDSYDDGASEMREINVNNNDVVIGVAASGTTPYTLGAIDQAGKLGALTIGIANNADTPILQNAAQAILAETGSEIIAGSTRMKAGTTQKAILNILSTAIMTKLGKVYNGLMVDMIVSNNKLENRAINMICDISGCSKNIASEALKKADRNIKKAVLISLGENLQASEEILAGARGNLRAA
ncbi:MAG: N-acetylmuramic acid 6-phosphate etherase, partial [Kordiimonadaceae bacterium]|nr:N-acetylmuramic acid 6-phosphate etherase [Kordiimonadaceae bacterium]